MAPVHVDPRRVREFPAFQSFYDWLAAHHDQEPEVWIKIHKKASGLPSITPVEAIDAVLCWGWIDSIKKGFDDRSFLQRYSPRGRKSVWSQINVDNVARLTQSGLMTQHGQVHVDAAKADGRWDAAYRTKGSEIPSDLMAAIDSDPRARTTFETLSGQNRFALVFRVSQMRTAVGRARKIAALTGMLARGETPHAQGTKD